MNIRKNIFMIALLCGCGFSYADSNDTAIDQSIKNNIAADRSLAGTTVNINTANGIVNVSGQVDSATQAERVKEIARSTSEVKDINDSKLIIKGSNHPIDDSIITTKIKSEFVKEKLFTDQDIASMSIKVETNNGVVSLSGTANNQEQINNAVKIAKSIAGVKKVTSTIIITHK